MLDLEVDIYEIGFDDGVYCALYGIERRPGSFIEHEIYKDGFTCGYKRQMLLKNENSEND